MGRGSPPHSTRGDNEIMMRLMVMMAIIIMITGIKN